MGFAAVALFGLDLVQIRELIGRNLSQLFGDVEAEVAMFQGEKLLRDFERALLSDVLPDRVLDRERLVAVGDVVALVVLGDRFDLEGGIEAREIRIEKGCVVDGDDGLARREQDIAETTSKIGRRCKRAGGDDKERRRDGDGIVIFQ
jgi:hypothetical protein